MQLSSQGQRQQPSVARAIREARISHCRTAARARGTRRRLYFDLSNTPSFNFFTIYKFYVVPFLVIFRNAKSHQPTAVFELSDDPRRLVSSGEYEIAMVKRANGISSNTHCIVAKKIVASKNECELEAVFIAACTVANAKPQAYPLIAGFEPNASTLHYGANNESLIGRQLVVLDAGAD
ncbi:uncharacterized protein F4807DRAFT_389212 [Annulohypoxylon truncatum]|uniref:uncharacterized protein n=1 Tax=Annulohypoxylon truncatum TaxID=327061 RepID=UPI002008856C|nr:uncharacterized protein F4807DRAFT_389212 [Annulohypoxylon truncatum]KAI1212147.1 hypothetical protein F4807DRAFT_389212 [Annulohypoxylon truncatum]